MGEKLRVRSFISVPYLTLVFILNLFKINGLFHCSSWEFTPFKKNLVLFYKMKLNSVTFLYGVIFSELSVGNNFQS